MTKEEVRVVVLAKLCLQENLIFWDVGAGTGTVAIEVARLLRGGTVFAVERDGEAFALLQENAETFGVGNLVPVRGEAPEALDKLPDPDRVFVGGSGGHLREILEVATARLKKGGVIVVSAITLETLTLSVNFLEGRNFLCAVTLLNVLGVKRAGEKHLLYALNPVSIIQGKERGTW
ncbi:MAG: precorrin-6Y C5,15-methyltransferase (decarboxylating) subunit CbiT [Candidatus Caldatribacteriaceae bacterium]